jgi:hypothetical protein
MYSTVQYTYTVKLAITAGCRGWEYPGEEVWRLQVETTAQMEALATLEAAHRMDFWTEVI